MIGPHYYRYTGLKDWQPKQNLVIADQHSVHERLLQLWAEICSLLRDEIELRMLGRVYRDPEQGGMRADECLGDIIGRDRFRILSTRPIAYVPRASMLVIPDARAVAQVLLGG